MTPARAVAPLFAPLVIGSLRLPNRIVMAPMTRSFSPAGTPGPDVAAYYARRARLGVGLIVTEGCWVPHPGAANNDRAPRCYGEAALAGWRRVVAEVHAAGGRIVPQLWHVGLIGNVRSEGALPAERVGPSGIVGGADIPLARRHAAMQRADIDAVVDAFATAAASARSIGFDGVALHGGHGYLIDQFFWHATNRRRDAYGGSPARRARFAADIVAEIRRRTAPDFPIVLRLSQWKLHDYGARLAETPAELARLLEPLVDAGVDLFDCSQRRFWEPAFPGSDLNLAGWVKTLSGRPTMTVGSIGLDGEFMASLAGRECLSRPATIRLAIGRLHRGEYDLVGIGRGLIADPAWASKVASGDLDRIACYSPSALERLH